MAPGHVEHPLRVGNRPNIPIANNRDTFHRFDHLANSIQVDDASESLGSRTPMDRDGSHADFFELASEFGGGDLGVIPAEPHLDRHRDPNGLDHGLDELHRFGRLAHHGGTATTGCNAGDRASHVDVDRVDPVLFQELRCVLHDRRVAAEDLHGKRAILGTGFDQLQRLPAALHQRPGTDEIGRAEPDAAQFAANPPEREIRIPRQRRDQIARR